MTESKSKSRIELAQGVNVPRSALSVTFTRSRGPGGQAVNKQNTRAELRVSMNALNGLSDSATSRLRKLSGRRLTQDGEIVLRSDATRSQARNRERCLERLKSLVREAARVPKARKKRKPTRAMIEKRLETKRYKSEKKRRRRPNRIDINSY